MKDPAFLFYPNDYIGGTMGWTFEQKGAYIELLMMQFNRGHMTTHMIGHTLGQTVGQTPGQLWEVLRAKFDIDENGLFFNRRLEEEQNRRKAYSASRRNNLKGENQHTKQPEIIEKNGGHMTSHMETENTNIVTNIESTSRNKIGVEKISKKDREQHFREQAIKTAADKYPQDMVQAFADYWTESNPTGHKLKFETHKIFDITRRLNTWAGKSFNQAGAARSKSDSFAKGMSNFD